MSVPTRVRPRHALAMLLAAFLVAVLVPATGTSPAVAVPPICDPTDDCGDPPPSCTLRDITPPAMTGTVMYGQTVSVDRGTWAGAAAYSYQWLLDGQPIDGATGSSYAVPYPVDTGQETWPSSTLSVTVTATSPFCDDPVSKTAPAVAVQDAPGPVPIGDGAVTLNGAGQVGESLTMSDAAWDLRTCATSPGFASLRYEWYVDGELVAGAGGRSPADKTLALTPAMLGKPVHARVAAWCQHRTTGWAQSPDRTVKIGQHACATPAKYLGTPTVGDLILVVDPVCASAPEIGYQWLRDGADIPGETARGHVVTAEDAGHTLSVSLTLHTDGYLDAHPLLSIGAVAVSSPGPGEGAGPGTPPSSNPSDPPASQQPLPTLVRSGHGKPALIRHGHTVRLALKAKRLRKLVVPSAASLGFQWYRGSARIVGATEADHRLRTADRGKRLRILVTLTRPGYQPLRLWTRWVRVRG